MAAGVVAWAQTPDTLRVKSDTLAVRDTVRVPLTAAQLRASADSLRCAYDFGAAIDRYASALRACTDSLERIAIEDAATLAQNGLSMMSYCSQVEVVAKERVPLKDFFLFYPLRDRSWRRSPNQLDSLGGDPMTPAVYVPDSTSTIYYSATDAAGSRNIYRTQLLDSLWSRPRLINEHVTSDSDEVFPMLSPDGKSLYFASRGLYGMGGYDLYMSRWNKESGDWDVPVNMGFPYSSPADDFLFINTEDGKYSIFASNRECSRDSVYIYVLEYDSMPLRHSVSDAATLRSLSMLQPSGDPSLLDNSAATADEPGDAGVDMRRYMDKMDEVKSLRDTIYNFNHSLDEMRAGLALLSQEMQKEQIAAIQESELSLPRMQARLEKAVKDLQSIEMEFLMSGVVLDPEKLRAKSDKEVVGASTNYTFVKNSMGGAFSLPMEKPVEEFDYTFKVLPKGRFAENNTLPDGLVYQIQMVTVSRKLEEDELGGLSPVFEKVTPALKYIYSVGVFRSYADVLSQLNAVKRQGFKGAIITAWRDGRQMNVDVARSLEKKIVTVYAVDIFPNGQALPEAALNSIHQQTENEIVRSEEGGTTFYTVGPFYDRRDADALVTAVKAAGMQNVRVKELGQSLID